MTTATTPAPPALTRAQALASLRDAEAQAQAAELDDLPALRGQLAEVEQAIAAAQQTRRGILACLDEVEHVREWGPRRARTAVRATLTDGERAALDSLRRDLTAKISEHCNAGGYGLTPERYQQHGAFVAQLVAAQRNLDDLGDTEVDVVGAVMRLRRALGVPEVRQPVDEGA